MSLSVCVCARALCYVVLYCGLSAVKTEQAKYSTNNAYTFIRFVYVSPHKPNKLRTLQMRINYFCVILVLFALSQSITLMHAFDLANVF